jgi:hypothetical protein
MEKFGSIEIRVLGNKGNLELSPDNYDVKEIMAMLRNIEDLLYPTNKKDRPIISYNIQEGSVKHIFKTSIQAVIRFRAILIQLIDFKPRYDDNYLNSLIHKAKSNWKGIKPDEWLNNLRGGYDA